MVNTHYNKIISGWKNVFSVFTMAAGLSDEEIVESAFTTTNFIICEFMFLKKIEKMISVFYEKYGETGGVSELQEFFPPPPESVTYELMSLWGSK